jgi:hypothetical protein
MSAMNQGRKNRCEAAPYQEYISTIKQPKKQSGGEESSLIMNKGWKRGNQSRHEPLEQPFLWAKALHQEIRRLFGQDYTCGQAKMSFGRFQVSGIVLVYPRKEKRLNPTFRKYL